MPKKQPDSLRALRTEITAAKKEHDARSSYVLALIRDGVQGGKQIHARRALEEQGHYLRGLRRALSLLTGE